MKVNKIYNGIVEIENFVSKEDLECILSSVNNFTEDLWFEKKENLVYEWWEGKVLTSFANKVQKFASDKALKILMKIEENVKGLFIDALNVTGINLNRYTQDVFLDYHSDEWLNHPDHFIKYGAILYYNDNFDGGELHYKDLDISYKPKSGSLILHKGDIVHGTLPVKSNSVRYSSTFFIKELRGKPITLNKNIFERYYGL